MSFLLTRLVYDSYPFGQIIVGRVACGSWAFQFLNIQKLFVLRVLNVNFLIRLAIRKLIKNLSFCEESKVLAMKPFAVNCLIIVWSEGVERLQADSIIIKFMQTDTPFLLQSSRRGIEIIFKLIVYQTSRKSFGRPWSAECLALWGKCGTSSSSICLSPSLTCKSFSSIIRKVTGRENLRFDELTSPVRNALDLLLLGGGPCLFTWFCGCTAELELLLMEIAEKRLPIWCFSPTMSVFSSCSLLLDEDCWSLERRRIQAAAVAAIQKLRQIAKNIYLCVKFEVWNVGIMKKF